jgi:hypothetical protein
MKKLRLKVDEISVSGFEVLSTSPAAQGTVQGAEVPTFFVCPTRGEEPTCNLGSCNTGEPCSYCP